MLASVGLTPRQLAPHEYRELLSYGIGLTDLVKRRSGPDATLDQGDFNAAEFRQTIERVQPRAVAFNGKGAAEAFLERAVGYGQQPEKIGESVIFVLPSTSGVARRLLE